MWVRFLGLGRSPEIGNGNPLQCSCLENSMDRGAWLVKRVSHDWVLSTQKYEQDPKGMASLGTFQPAMEVQGKQLPWWLRQWRSCLQYRRPRFNLWIGKIRWKRKWQPTPVFLPGESHGQWSLVGYSPWGCKGLNRTERLPLSLWGSSCSHFHMAISRGHSGRSSGFGVEFERCGFVFCPWYLLAVWSWAGYMIFLSRSLWGSNPIRLWLGELRKTIPTSRGHFKD